MRLVGLTGGIGAGKSTVSEMLASRGAVIVDADRIARELQEAGSPVVTAMVERFGDGILSEDGSLDRAAVAAIVFGSDDDSRQALADLNGIVHPAMQSEIRRRIDAERDSDRLVVLDFPLLAENPRDDLDATIVVDVDPEVAVERLVAARGMDELDARNRIANQASRERRLAIATHVLDNSGDLDALAAQVESIWNDLS
ncbi:MAG: dephospho-CoA kinase [Ilumatobacteraceae bacterium]